MYIILYYIINLTMILFIRECCKIKISTFKSHKTKGGTMHKKKRTQLSFYDTIYDISVSKDHFLRKLNSVIDWRQFEHYFKRLHQSTVGKPAYNPLMKFKALVLQFLYDLSDRQLEEQLNDRISF